MVGGAFSMGRRRDTDKDYATMTTAALQRLLPKLIARANGERAGKHRDLTDAEREDARRAAWEAFEELRRR